MLTRAYELAAALPPDNGATRAKAACALAGALARGSTICRGPQRLVGEGLAAVPLDRAFVLDRCPACCGGSEVAREAGDSSTDSRTCSRPTPAARVGHGSALLATLSMTMELAEAYRNAGRT